MNFGLKSLLSLLMPVRARAGLALLLGALHAAPALADMWGYVDAQGISHFSAERLDERYELFFRANESFDTANYRDGVGELADGPMAKGHALVAASPSSLKILQYFDVSPAFKAVRHLLREASVTHGIDFELLQALIATESGFNAQAVSPKGAVGLMQLIPPTAERYGVKTDKNSPVQKKLTDPQTNIRAGSSYLRDLIDMFPGQLELALAAYNAGEGAVQRAGNKIPNFPETRKYVKTVMQIYTQLKPPAAPAHVSRTSGRVRLEMMGGSKGRSNTPQGLQVQVLPDIKSERD